MSVRVLEIIFFLYFASHIPITLFIDLQALLPEHVYPQPVSNQTRSYGLVTETMSPCRIFKMT